MKRVLIAITTFIVVICGFAIANYFWQQNFVDFFTRIDWLTFAGFVSGPWWNSLPIFILAVGVLSAMWFTFWQISEARKSTNAQIAVGLFRELRSEETLEKLRFIYILKPEKEELQKLHKKDKDSIDYVLNRLTTLGILVNERIIDKSLAIEGFSGPAVLRCWYQLRNYIKHLQQERGDYYENYEGFVSYCLKYFNKAHIKVKFNNIENLVTELQKPELHPRSLKKIKKDRQR